MLCWPDYEYAEVLKNKGVVRGLHLLDHIEAVLPGVEPYFAMALQQGHQQEEHIDLLHDIKLHWKQPKAVLSRLQTWTTQQPIAVEALVATLAGSAQVAARTAICRACHFMSAKSAKGSRIRASRGSDSQNLYPLQGAFLGGIMGTVTRLDPNTTNNLAGQPGANAGQNIDRTGDHHATCHFFLHAVRLLGLLHHTAELLWWCADMVKQMQAFQQGGPWVQARNFAVLTGVGAGLSIALKRVRKTDDVYNT